jgi:Tol biopolymer transport system component
LDRLVLRCLEKSPEERYQSARDLAFNLEALSTISAGDPSGATMVPPTVDVTPAPRSRSSGWTRAAIALVVGLAAGGAAAVWRTAPSPSTDTATYRQLTFRRGFIPSAHFAPDGQTIVYAAAWEGRPVSLFTGRVDGIGERPLSVDGQVEDVSSSGEVALLTNLQRAGNIIRGTLSRMPLAGGAPRAVLDNVGSASWGPDGQQLAIVRAKADGGWQLEFPMGTVLYDTRNWIETPRVSPDGTRVAFLEHPQVGGDNRGHVSVISSGQKTDVSGDYSIVIGLAWHPNGELWFSGSDSGLLTQLLAVRPGETVRRVAGLPAAVVLRDMRPDGGVLLETIARKARMLVRSTGEPEDRDIGWFDYPLLRDISADGKFILFDEEGEGGGADYSVFLRPTDGGPAVRLGDGYAQSLAPDMKHVLTSRPGRPGLRIVPIGPGETRDIPRITADYRPAGPPRWWPDGRSIVSMGSVGEALPRTYLVDITTGEARPITPEGIAGFLASPDARRLVVTAEGERRIFALDSGSMTPVRGLAQGDQVIRWSADGRSLFVSRALSARQRDLARLDLATGRREVIATFGPTDAAGLLAITPPVVSADGRVFAYRYQQVLSDLFIATGLK